MAQIKDLPPGKSVRVWTRLDHLPDMFRGPVPDQLGLLWFSYNTDASIYTNVGFVPSEIIDQEGRSMIPLPNAKISIHGSGKVLGPDRHEDHAVRPGDHLGFEIGEVRSRAEVCQHHLTSGGAYVVAFGDKEYARSTDAFWQGALETVGAHYLKLEVAPIDTDVSQDRWAWRTRPLDNGNQILIVANTLVTGAEFPPAEHYFRLPVAR